MQPVSWDVRHWAGKTASLQIVDDEQGGWGNIGVDDIVFSDRPREPLGPLAGRQISAPWGWGCCSEVQGLKSKSRTRTSAAARWADGSIGQVLPGPSRAGEDGVPAPSRSGRS